MIYFIINTRYTRSHLPDTVYPLTIPAAQRIAGTVYAFDIDPQMIAACKTKAAQAGISNVECQQRDFIAAGTGLPDESVEYVMLFNILHAEDPIGFLKEAHRILVSCGKVGVIHWNYDPSTPRGPSMDIRPRPEQCQAWIQASGFKLTLPLIDLPPYHYGIVGEKELGVTQFRGKLRGVSGRR